VRGLVLGSRRLNIFARGTEVEVTGDVHGLQIDVIDDSTDRSAPV